MAVVKKTNKKKTIILIAILVVIIIAIIFLLSRFIIQPGGEEPGVMVPPGVKPEVKVKLSEEIFRDPRFIELKEHGALPVEVGERGRENPFEPF